MSEFDDLPGITRLMRNHVPIRNRTYLKRHFKSCFIGKEGVDWLVDQGFAQSREEGVEIGKKMQEQGLLKHVTDSHSFKDERLYYRFHNDDLPSARLRSKNAGNGDSVHFGKGCEKIDL